MNGAGYNPPLSSLVEELKTAVHTKKSKNVEILHLAASICRAMKGLRYLFFFKFKILFYSLKQNIISCLDSPAAKVPKIVQEWL
jgi:hypothetical protein